MESSSTEIIYASTENTQRVFSIDFKEINYNFAPAYVFYLTSMSLNLKLMQLQKSVERKRAAYNWLENLTSTVSHEMRTPLGGIMQNA